MSAIYFALTENWEKKMKNKMKINKKMLLCCFLAMITMLSGCSLAKEDGFESESTRLIGVYITTKEIFPDGTEFFPAKPENAGKIFAELKVYTDTNPVTGESAQISKYVFEGTEGYELFSPVTAASDGSSYTSLQASDVFSGIKYVFGDLSSIEGMIYVAPDFSEILYANPVYQNIRGEVFMLSGSGYRPSSPEADEGERFAMTISEEYKETVNGKTSISGMSVKITIGVKYRPTGINIIQIDAKSSVTDIKKYKPDALPKKVFPAQKTQYLIAETYSADYEGKPCVNREIIESGKEYTNSCSADETGIFRNFAVYFVWADGAEEN